MDRAIHTELSAGAIPTLLCPVDAPAPHHLHRRRYWQVVATSAPPAEGVPATAGLQLLLDSRLLVLDVARQRRLADVPRQGATTALYDGSATDSHRETTLRAYSQRCQPGSYWRAATAQCAKCPPGRFGDTDTLRSPEDCTPCPAGTYRDSPGAAGRHDCAACPAGRWGAEPGLEAATCSGQCALGTRGRVTGARTREEACEPCPPGYSGGTCLRHTGRNSEAKGQRTKPSSRRRLAR